MAYFLIRFWLWLVEDPIIEAIARLEFEDGLRTGVLSKRLLKRPHLAYDQFQIPWGCGLVLEAVYLSCQTKFQFC